MKNIVVLERREIMDVSGGTDLTIPFSMATSSIAATIFIISRAKGGKISGRRLNSFSVVGFSMIFYPAMRDYLLRDIRTLPPVRVKVTQQDLSAGSIDAA